MAERVGADTARSAPGTDTRRPDAGGPDVAGLPTAQRSTWVLEGWAAERLAAARVPGAAGVLVDRELGCRPFVWGRRAPWPGAAAVTPSTLFRWYSLTKPFTAALAEVFVRAGRLSPEQRVDRHLPELAAVLGDRPGARPIRVADLLLHRAGFRDRPLDAAGWFRAAGLDWPDPQLALASVLGRRPRFLGDAATRSHYSNLGYAVLGQLLARVGGAPFRELLRRHVLAPLGVDAAFAFDELPRSAPRSDGVVSRWSSMGWALASRRARGFVAQRRGPWLWIRPREAIFSPHGGLVGRPGELAGLLGERLARRPGPLDGLSAPASRWSGEQVVPGWYRARRGGLGLVERHGGRGPGFTGELLVAPERGRALCLVVNRDLPLTRLCARWLARPGNLAERWRRWEP